ncbi:MAG: hypothetical protein KKG00_14860, partial [Bacteroidetes bacterium]|nr:hypothetical protein [Bacteroidota bacterium]
LEELQKWVRENISIEERESITKTFLENPQIATNLNDEKPKLGLADDGSYGFHNSSRENGRFGSLSSFDNYDDDYTDHDFDDEFK